MIYLLISICSQEVRFTAVTEDTVTLSSGWVTMSTGHPGEYLCDHSLSVDNWSDNWIDLSWWKLCWRPWNCGVKTTIHMVHRYRHPYYRHHNWTQTLTLAPHFGIDRLLRACFSFINFINIIHILWCVICLEYHAHSRLVHAHGMSAIWIFHL